MASNSVPAYQVLKQAHAALQRGDKQAARRRVQIVATIAPEVEDPWLILAAVARPSPSIASLERALAIHPAATARQGDRY